MGSSEKEICIKCNKGGDVLACADSSCPIAVHVSCMGFPARYDDLGNFYCPYCLHRQSFAKVRQAREQVVLKKKALHTFIDKEMISSNKEIPSIVSQSTDERADKPLPEKKNDVPESNCDLQQVAGEKTQLDSVAAHGSEPIDHTSSKAIATDLRVLHAGNMVQATDQKEVGDEHIVERSVEVQHQNGIISNSCVAEKGKARDEPYQVETKRNSIEIAGEQETGVDETTADHAFKQHLKGKRRVECGESTYRKSKRLSKRRTSGRQVKTSGEDHVVTDTPTRLTRASTSLLKNNNLAGKLVQVKQPSTSSLQLPNVKHKRVLWRPEEEEMLEEGVKQFSTKINKNIPWRKILELGDHVFDRSRTPTDLKDKWKTMCSKYGGRA